MIVPMVVSMVVEDCGGYALPALNNTKLTSIIL